MGNVVSFCSVSFATEPYPKAGDDYLSGDRHNLTESRVAPLDAEAKARGSGFPPALGCRPVRDVHDDGSDVRPTLAASRAGPFEPRVICCGIDGAPERRRRKYLCILAGGF